MKTTSQQRTIPTSTIEDPKDTMSKMGFSAEEIARATENIHWSVVDHNTYTKYGIVTTQLIKNGQAMRDISVVHDLKRGGQFRVSTKYHLIAHEQILEYVNHVKDELGLDMELIKDARTSGGYYNLRNEDGMTVSKDGRYMCSSYVLKNHATIEVKAGDKIESGLTILNTIDGSTAFYVVPMTLRLACNNQMPHMMASIRGANDLKHKRIYELAQNSWNISPVLQNKYENFEKFLAIAQQTRFIHNKKLSEEVVMNNIALKAEMVKDYLEDYPRIAKTKLDKKFVEQVIGISTPYSTALPVSVTKDVIEDGAHVCGFSATRKKGEWKDLTVNENMTQYDLFNSYTDHLSHDPNRRSTINSNLNSFAKLQSLLNFGSSIQGLTPTAQ